MNKNIKYISIIIFVVASILVAFFIKNRIQNESLLQANIHSLIPPVVVPANQLLINPATYYNSIARPAITPVIPSANPLVPQRFSGSSAFRALMAGVRSFTNNAFSTRSSSLTQQETCDWYNGLNEDGTPRDQFMMSCESMNRGVCKVVDFPFCSEKDYQPCHEGVVSVPRAPCCIFYSQVPAGERVNYSRICDWLPGSRLPECGPATPARPICKDKFEEDGYNCPGMFPTNMAACENYTVKKRFCSSDLKCVPDRS